MEQDFGERLRDYRKAKNLTQQELGDRLGVSNKTVSRWESGGGYPDVPVLVPLARMLGVSVDDLLDDEKPVRTLTAADWQSLLSFAFAMGGGVLFYLLDLFMPTVVCYLAYLGCLAYGTYLQRYYCYHGKWFLVGCAVMNFCVNISLAVSLLAVPLFFSWTQRALLPLPTAQPSLLVRVAALLLPVLLLTALTMALVSRFILDSGPLPGYRIRLERPKI